MGGVVADGPQGRLPARRGASPTVRLSVACVLAVVALFAMRQVSSPDIGFHLAAGTRILEGQGWPRTDPFTYTVADHAYLDTSWGYQVVIAAIERVAGTPGMVLFHVALALALFGLLAAAARLVPGEIRVLGPLLLLAAVAAEFRFQVRPEMLSYTLLALVLYLLHRRAEGLRTPLWLLPLVFWVWVNAHGLFVLGGIAVACFVVGGWWSRRRCDLPLVAWSAVALGLGLVNPYGWRALVFPLLLSTRMDRANVFQQNIGEFLSPLSYLGSDQLHFYLLPLAAWLLLALLVVASLPALWRQRRYGPLLLAVTFLPLSLAMVRNIPPLAVACLPGAVFGLSFDCALDRLRLRGSARRLLHRGFLVAFLVVAAGLGLRVATDAYYLGSRRLERTGLGWNERVLPVAATDYVRRAGLEGRMLNHLNFGAWLIWSLDRPVFIDGRLEVMGEAFYAEYRRALDTPAGLAAAVRAWDVRWIIFPYQVRPDLLGGLSRAPDWRLVYADRLAAIFVRRDDPAIGDPGLRDWVRPAETVELGSLPGLGGGARRCGVGAWLAGFAVRRDYPTDAVHRGVFHFHRGEPARAASAFARAIRESDGAYHETYNNLGSALAALGRLTEAGECYRLYLAELPWYRRDARRRVRERLARLAQADGI